MNDVIGRVCQIRCGDIASWNRTKIFPRSKLNVTETRRTMQMHEFEPNQPLTKDPRQFKNKNSDVKQMRSRVENKFEE